MQRDTVLVTGLTFTAIFLTNVVRFKIAYVVQSMAEDDNFVNLTEADQSYMLGSYFYGYVVTQIPLAVLGRGVSNSQVLGIMFFLTGVTNILLFFATSPGQVGLARILIGLFQGGSYPLVHGIWHEVADEENLSNLVSIEYAGGGFGGFLAIPLCVLIGAAFGRWELVFVIVGGACLLFSVIWLLYFKHLENCGKVKKTTNDWGEIFVKVKSIPWISIFTSVPFWGLVVVQFCSNYASYTIQLLSVKYIREFLLFDLSAAGLWSSVPVLSKPVSAILAGVLSVYVIRRMNEVRGGDNRLFVRRLLCWIEFGVSAICFISVIFVRESLAGCLVCWSIVMGMDGLGPAAFKSNFIEIAPSLAGVVFSVANTIGNFPGFLAPMISAEILKAYVEDPGKAWSVIFVETGVVSILGAVVFQVFGTVEQQKWDPWEKDVEPDKEGEELKAAQPRERE